MQKQYIIKLDGKPLGFTYFEKADPPMGVVFGKIHALTVSFGYTFIKEYCLSKGIEITYDEPEQKSIATETIPALEVISEGGRKIESLGNQIAGMDSDGFELSLEGISDALYGIEFPQHLIG